MLYPFTTSCCSSSFSSSFFIPFVFIFFFFSQRVERHHISFVSLFSLYKVLFFFIFSFLFFKQETRSFLVFLLAHFILTMPTTVGVVFQTWRNCREILPGNFGRCDCIMAIMKVFCRLLWRRSLSSFSSSSKWLSVKEALGSNEAINQTIKVQVCHYYKL